MIAIRNDFINNRNGTSLETGGITLAQEIEIEFKNLITEGEYHSLIDDLPFDINNRFTQTNYYFETDDFALRDHGSALRIRKKGDTWTATLKEPHEEGLLETHDTLTEDEVNEWLNGSPAPAPFIKNRLAALGVMFTDLQFRGALMTERMEIEYKDTLLVLDRSHYHNQTDFELELEAKEKQHGETIFTALLDQYNISKRQTPNKIQRFFAAMPKTD